MIFLDDITNANHFVFLDSKSQLKRVLILRKLYSSTGLQLSRMNNFFQFSVSPKVTIICLTVLPNFLLESTINMVLRLNGGKKKRKKKIYTKPKKIAHKHKKRPKAILEYFNVDNTGKISKLKIECEKCPAGKSGPINQKHLVNS